nr:hypothetical protein CFP56_24365 [Quercus suber]
MYFAKNLPSLESLSRARCGNHSRQTTSKRRRLWCKKSYQHFRGWRSPSSKKGGNPRASNSGTLGDDVASSRYITSRDETLVCSFSFANVQRYTKLYVLACMVFLLIEFPTFSRSPHDPLRTGRRRYSPGQFCGQWAFALQAHEV